MEVSWRCGSKVPQTTWIKRAEFISPQFYHLKVGKQGVSMEEGPTLPFSASGAPRRLLAYDSITPISATIFTLPSYLCVHVFLSSLPASLFPLLIKTLNHTGLGTTVIEYDLILTWVHLQRPHFRIRSHSPIPGIRSSTYLVRDTTHPTTEGMNHSRLWCRRLNHILEG